MNLKEKKDKAIRDMTRHAIRDGVIEVMAEQGLSGVTMARVAERAGIAKGSIYLHYKDKDELMQDTVTACFQPLIEQANEIFELDLSPDEKLARLIDSHHIFFSENQSLFKMLLIDHQAVRLDKKKKENDHYKEIIERLSALIREGVEKQIFKPVNPRATAIILMESNLQLTFRLLEQKNQLQMEPGRSADIIREILFNGILA